MLKLQWLEFEAIGRFVEKQRIDFTRLGSLVQVDGVWKNTGGSSGAAKSTVFRSLDFLFGVSDKPTTVLQSRLTKDTMTVKAGFDFDGKPLIISRGKKLSVDLDGHITTGSSKLAEEALDLIIGMDRDLFRKMYHKRQKEGGFFLKMTPKEIYDFLTGCLGLSEQGKKIVKIDSRIGLLTNLIAQSESDIKNIEAAIEATNNARSALGEPPKCSVDQASVLRTKQALDVAQTHFTKVQADHSTQTAALEAERPKLGFSTFDSTAADIYDKERTEVRAQIQSYIEKERARQDEVRKWSADFKAELYRLHNQIASASTAKKEAVSVATEIKKVRASICPTCDQSWITEAARFKEEALFDKLEKIKETIQIGQQAEDRNLYVTGEIQRLEEDLRPLHVEEHSRLLSKERDLNDLIRNLKRAEETAKEAEHAQQNAIHNAFAVRQGQLRATQNTELEKVRSEVESHRRSLDAGVHELKSHSVAVAKHEQSLVTLNNQLIGYADKLIATKSSLANAKSELLLAEELKRAIKSYISCSFDDALVAIGDTATRMIRNLPNMANGTIRLLGTKETKEGKVKEEVNAVVDNDGEESVPLKSFCGGEESAIDLAVDLAVIDFVENKANKGIDVFALDEPFTGMDTVIIEDALQVLKTANSNKRLVIVDHNPEVKQMVESRLLVVRDGSTSKVEQA